MYLLMSGFHAFQSHSARQVLLGPRLPAGGDVSLSSDQRHKSARARS
jgi:hypothetical protein